jgi:ABC-type uncharacterized transport system substrate-binding protein
MVKWLPLLIVAAELAFPFDVAAHPHVWVTVKTAVLFKDNAIVGLQQSWTFDEFYAAMAIEGLDKNGDGAYDRQELDPLAKVNMDGIREFKYFTFAKVGGNAVDLSPAPDYWMEYANKLLTLHFTLTLGKPVPAPAKDFAFSTYDGSFYIDFELAEKDPISLLGDVPQGCSATVAKGEADTQSLSDAFRQQFGDATYGGTMGQPAKIECPGP